MRGTGRSRSLGRTLSPLAWLGVLLGLAAFCLMLGALSALQNGCNKGIVNGGGDTTLRAALNYGVTPTCRRAYRYQWFITFLELTVLFLTFVALVTGLHRNMRVALVGLAAVAAVLLIELTNRFLTLHDETDGKLQTRVDVFFAGTLIAATANFLIILGLGTGGDDHYDHDHHKTIDNPVAAPPGAQTTATV